MTQSPIPNPQSSAVFTAFYDLSHGPISYDFVTWLVRAKMAAAGRRLHVVIVPKEDGVGGFSRDWGGYDEHEARWRLWHIVIACCPLAGATVTLAPSRDWAVAQSSILDPQSRWFAEGKQHFMGPLVEAARRGEQIPKLKATEQARRYVRASLGGNNKPGKLVTLTIRQQASDVERNSDLRAWLEFSSWLSERGYNVRLLDDANFALMSGRGYAELDPDLRLALYECAALNVIGNNGPQELLKFSDAPFIAMGQALSKGWQDHFRKYFAMEPGDQLPWARPDQRLVYEADTFENLTRAFGTVMGEA